MLDTQDIKDKKEHFKRIDQDNDGQLTREELVAAYRTNFGELAEYEVDKIM